MGEYREIWVKYNFFCGDCIHIYLYINYLYMIYKANFFKQQQMTFCCCSLVINASRVDVYEVIQRLEEHKNILVYTQTNINRKAR